MPKFGLRSSSMLDSCAEMDIKCDIGSCLGEQADPPLVWRNLPVSRLFHLSAGGVYRFNFVFGNGPIPLYRLRATKNRLLDQ